MQIAVSRGLSVSFFGFLFFFFFLFLSFLSLPFHLQRVCARSRHYLGTSSLVVRTMAMTDEARGRPNEFDQMSASTSSVNDLGHEEQIHILQGQVHELGLRIDTVEADLKRRKRLLVQISNRLHDFKLRQAEHDQQVRNFILAVHRAADVYIRNTQY
jgi:hypothetical protein